MGVNALKRGLCWCGIHNWADYELKAFNDCKWCGKVIWFTGEWSWDLDICDTRKYYQHVDVWP